jgi:DNA-binding MarR family transcriptional regulator
MDIEQIRRISRHIIAINQFIDKIGLQISQNYTLTISELRLVLFLMTKEKPCNMSDLAKEMIVTQAQVTKTFKTLQAKGLVVSQKGEEDKRQVMASLSKEGIALLQKSRNLREYWLINSVKGFNDSELEQAEQLLFKIHENVGELHEMYMKTLTNNR